MRFFTRGVWLAKKRRVPNVGEAMLRIADMLSNEIPSFPETLVFTSSLGKLSRGADSNSSNALLSRFWRLGHRLCCARYLRCKKEIARRTLIPRISLKETKKASRVVGGLFLSGEGSAVGASAHSEMKMASFDSMRPMGLPNGFGNERLSKTALLLDNPANGRLFRNAASDQL